MHTWWAKPLGTFSALETNPVTNGSRAPTHRLQPVLKPAWPSSVTGGLEQGVGGGPMGGAPCRKPWAASAQLLRPQTPLLSPSPFLAIGAL